jgi:DME family drug/metabolite transporter
LRGIAMVLAAAVLWGTTGTAQTFAPAGVSPYVVGAMRVGIASLFFWCYLALSLRGRWQGVFKGVPWTAMLFAGACMAVYNLTFFAGVKASSVAVGTAVAIGSGPVWAGVLQFVVTRQAPTPVWWWGTLLAVGGGSLMVMGGAAQVTMTVSGIVFCLLAGLSYAAYALINKRLVSSADPSLVTAVVFSASTLIAVPMAMVFAQGFELASSSWAVFTYLGVVTTGVTYLLFSHGLRHISGATGVTLALAEPMTAFLLALVVVGERPGVGAFCGLAMVLAGLALVIRAEMKAGRSTEAL